MGEAKLIALGAGALGGETNRKFLENRKGRYKGLDLTAMIESIPEETLGSVMLEIVEAGE